MCELLHTSNHHYFDGNNKGPLLPYVHAVIAITKKRFYLGTGVAPVRGQKSRFQRGLGVRYPGKNPAGKGAFLVRSIAGPRRGAGRVVKFL
jgi:hypothetical protein